MAKRVYTPEQKQEALVLVPEIGQRETGRRLGIPEGTVSVWARNAGVKAAYVEKLRAGTIAAAAKNEDRRTELRGLLIEYAVKLMKRMDDPHIDFKSSGPLGPVQVTFPVAPAAACQHYATSVGILIDKYRLENGEVTGREEHRHDFSHLSDAEIEREIVREAERITRGAAEAT